MESNVQKIIDTIEENDRKEKAKESKKTGVTLFTVVYTVFVILVNVGLIARPASGFSAWVWDCLKGWSCIPFYFLAVLVWAFIVVAFGFTVLALFAAIVKD
jgi:sterol desaturase/sphingolipid hydroxylase (fatty acid hydroxylase superfamily)